MTESQTQGLKEFVKGQQAQVNQIKEKPKQAERKSHAELKAMEQTEKNNRLAEQRTYLNDIEKGKKQAQAVLEEFARARIQARYDIEKEFAQEEADGLVAIINKYTEKRKELFEENKLTITARIKLWFQEQNEKASFNSRMSQKSLDKEKLIQIEIQKRVDELNRQ